MQLRDTSGKIVSLSDIHGNFIYYDFWASWCHPCMGEMQPTKDLQKQFADGKITWVFISYDRDVNAWKKAIRATGVKGIQLIATEQDINTFKNELSIYSIPFNIWATGENKIVKYDAPHPSEGIYDKLSKMLEKYGQTADSN